MSLTLQSLRTLGHRHIDTSGVPGQSVNRVGWVKGPGEFVAHSVKKQDLPNSKFALYSWTSAKILTNGATSISKDELPNEGHPEHADWDITWSNHINSGALLSP